MFLKIDFYKNNISLLQKRMSSPKIGNDVPKLCSDPDIVTGFQEELSKIQSAKPWGFWEFITLKTNKYDIKNSISRNGIKYDIFNFCPFSQKYTKFM